MLGNLINRHDAVRLYRALRRGQLAHVVGKLRAPGPDRVLAHGSAAGHPAGEVQWDEIPAIRRRWHTFGRGQTSFADQVTRRWLAGRPGLQALSLGSGSGEREIEWARLGVFERITGVDISPGRAGRATRHAEEAGLDDALSFRAADAREALREAEGQYDVVLALNALHHFGHPEEIMRLIARALRPGGLLILDEYVGPSRFQWAAAQLRAANALLAGLPDEQRIRRDGRVKRRVIRPSRLSMRLDDPSEAVESDGLMPALDRHFEVLEQHPYGSILHLALHGIAHNFLAEDPATTRVMRQCLAAEERSLSRLGHDFTYAVCAPLAVPRPGPAAVPGARRRPRVDTVRIMSHPPTTLSSAVAALGSGRRVPRRPPDWPPRAGRRGVRRGWRLVRAGLVPDVRPSGRDRAEHALCGSDGRLAPAGEAHRRLAVGPRRHGAHGGGC